MAKTLGGASFIHNGIVQDYNYRETIDCLVELCDKVVIVDAGSTDGTYEDLRSYIDEVNKPFYNTRVLLIRASTEEWHAQQGREKLSFFSNIAISALSTDWVFYLQMDEILHEDSFPYVRAAIEEDGVDGYLVSRLNLWKDPHHMLNVPQERKPVSTEVIRLAKTKFRCFDDAESLAVDGVMGIFGDVNNIQIFHMGFIRDKVKHLEKIKHMQKEVFLWGDYDAKAKDCTEFQPDRWFDPEKDLVPIPKPLPKFIQQWCFQRYGS